MKTRTALCWTLFVGCSTRDATPTPEPPVAAAPAPPALPAPPAEPPACSASGLRVVLPEQALPPAVAATRERIAAHALACSYDELEALAQASGRPFHFTFGDASSPAGFWRAAEAATPAGGLGPMAALPRVLALTPCRQAVDGRTWWVWPAVQCGDATEAQWAEVRGLYDDETIAVFREMGGYMGWRTAIVDDGGWAYFVAGD